MHRGTENLARLSRRSEVLYVLGRSEGVQAELETRNSPRGKSFVSGNSRSTSRYLAYTPPYDWETMLETFRTHQVPDLEAVDKLAYERVVRTSLGLGWFQVTHDADRASLRLKVWNASPQDSVALVKSVRQMFDLDADLAAIHDVMKEEPYAAMVLWKELAHTR